jgi:hypothetical protein
VPPALPRAAFAGLLVTLSSLAPLVAGAADTPPDAPQRARLTSLDVGPLTRSTAVVLGSLRVLVPGDEAAVKVARVSVEKTLWGSVEGTELTVFIGGTRNTADPRRPSEDFLGGQREGRFVLFLARSPRGSGYGVESVVPAEGDEGREKSEVLERELAIQALSDDDARARRMLDLLLRLLDAPGVWSRQHAARELDLLSLARPDLFTASVRTEVRAHRRRTFDEASRTRLDRVLDRAEGPDAVPVPATPPSGAPAGPAVPPAARPLPPAPPPPTPAAPSAPAPVTGSAPQAPPTGAPAADPEVARLRRQLAGPLDPDARRDLLSELARRARGGAEPDLLAAFESSAEPLVRERAAVLLGDVGARASLPRLLARFATETDTAVREAVVRAVGLLGDDSVVPWLAARLGDPALVRAAAFALARVRTGAALDQLEGLRVRSLRSTPPDEATAALVVYLRSAAFVERERVAGREVGPRPPLPGAVPPSGGGSCPVPTSPKEAPAR